MMSRLSVTVIGAGVIGLWQALELARRGHAVTLREAVAEEFCGAASRFAGAMLAPHCESESAPPIVAELGLRAIDLWRRTYPGVFVRGTLVVAAMRDQAELTRFARMTRGHVTLNARDLATYEPEIGRRFPRGLFYAEEGHLAPRAALQFLIRELRRLDARLRFADPVAPPIWLAASAGEVVIDCRGIGAREDLPGLRGVRGEMAVVEAPHLRLSRPIRLLHPRFPLYVVPWGGGQYMIGATVIESDETGPVTLRSALDLLATACAIHPGFADATIRELSSGIRPAFADNVPGVIVSGRRILVNGAYRHGFLLAPVLAEAVADYLEKDIVAPGLFRDA